MNRLNYPDTDPYGRPVFSVFPGTAILLLFAVLFYGSVFSVVSILGFRNFGMSAFDIGIHVQAIWKLSTGRGLFNTVRGLPIWGDHCWFVMLLYLPLYWLVPRVETLLVLQSFALALAAMPLAAIILRRGGGRLAAMIFALAWLLSPVLQNMNLENFHPEVLAAPFLLWSVERADAGKWKGYWLAIAAALLCKEDVALTVFMIGFWIFIRNRRIGLLTMIISLAWFLLCMKLFLPYFNGHGFFRFEGGYWFSRFWQHKLELYYYLETFSRTRVGLYAWKLGMPLLFLFLLNPLLGAAALPGFLVNVLSGNDYLISIDYHYNFQTLPLLFSASAMAFCSLKLKTEKLPFVCWALLAGILGASIWANVHWSLLPVNKIKGRLSSQYSFFKKSGTEKRFKGFAALLPGDPDVPVSVSHNLLPHLAHRNAVYMFPNPFKAQYWGIQGENPPLPDTVEMILLDTTTLDHGNREIFRNLIQTGKFMLVKEEGPLVLAKKAAEDSGNQVIDPMDMKPPAENIRLLVYQYKTELLALNPLWGRKPDADLTTSEMRIPLTAGRLKSAEGSDLGGHDNLRLFFLGRWHAAGRQPLVFRLQADDGCRLYLDNRPVIDYEGVHAYGQMIESSPLQLEEGPHDIKLDYFEWGGEAGLMVEWAPVGGNFQVLKVGQKLP